MFNFRIKQPNKVLIIYRERRREASQDKFAEAEHTRLHRIEEPSPTSDVLQASIGKLQYK